MLNYTMTIDQEARDYYPDIELQGSGNMDYGHYLAERLTKKQGSENIPDHSLEGNINKAKEIFSEYVPREVYNSTKQRQFLKAAFGRLEKAGFEVGDFKVKTTPELMNDYMAFKREYLDS